MEEKWIHLRQTVLEAIPRVGRTPQNCMGRLRYTKTTHPLSSCGSIIYNAAKYLASILTPLVGKNCHSIKNTKELVDKLRGLEIPPARKLVSYDVIALFTSVPVDKALEVITEKLQEDDTLTSGTEMTIPQIVELLDFCLDTTYFMYNGAYYQQMHGAAMGSPMKQFDKVAISTGLHPPPITVATIRGRHIHRTSRKRIVKEAIYIKQRAPTMNRDQGYHLPAIYNQIIRRNLRQHM